MTAIAETGTENDQVADEVLRLSRLACRGNVDYIADNVMAEMELTASHARAGNFAAALSTLGRLLRWDPSWGELSEVTRSNIELSISSVREAMGSA